MSTQPNRKQQRLARERARSKGIAYQTALAEVRGQATTDPGGVPTRHPRQLFDDIDRDNPDPER